MTTLLYFRRNFYLPPDLPGKLHETHHFPNSASSWRISSPSNDLHDALGSSRLIQHQILNTCNDREASTVYFTPAHRLTYLYRLRKPAALPSEIDIIVDVHISQECLRDLFTEPSRTTFAPQVNSNNMLT